MYQLGTFPTDEMHLLGTVPTDKMHPVGTVHVKNAPHRTLFFFDLLFLAQFWIV